MRSKTVKTPLCPNCGEQMIFVLIEQGLPGYDRRLYSCPECRLSEDVVTARPSEPDDE
jgi:predicted RNA-binding Zn-ribbon protein involved in translation (DUF1610 family)